MLVFIIIIRTLTLGLSDLIDPTESRYAFVAQEMVLSGNWITPKLPLPDGLQPYLGKPPLHFWQTAIAMQLFGMDAWVARIPSLLAWLLIGACAWFFTTRLLRKESALHATVITLSSGLVFFLAGSSTIDVTFSAWISGALTSFAICAHEGRIASRARTLSGYAFFVFTALAFLTKGPAALILIGLALFFWLCARDARDLFPTLPWIGGTIIALLIVVPWFLLSEQQNPGFLYYFFVQENFLRFVSRDYGDRFGTGHVYPRGSALWMLLLAFMPWTPIFLGLMLFSAEARQKLRTSSPWLRYALCWGIAPAIFFSFARQLHVAYVLPGIAGLGIALTILIEDSSWTKVSSLMRALRLSALVIAAGAIPTSYFFNANWIAITSAIVLVLVSYSVLRGSAENTDQNKIGISLSFAFATALMYGSIFIVFSHHAGRIKSGRIILSHIAQSLAGSGERVVFLSHNSYSFYYYPRDWQHQLGAAVTTAYEPFDQILRSPPPHLIVNKSDIARIPHEFKERYAEQANLGKWKWWKKLPNDEQSQ